MFEIKEEKISNVFKHLGTERNSEELSVQNGPECSEHYTHSQEAEHVVYRTPPEIFSMISNG